MQLLTNLDAYLFIPILNECLQAQAFTDSKGYQIYEFVIGPKEANGFWGEEVVVIFKGMRKTFKIEPFDKTAMMKYTAIFRYGKFDHMFYFRINV